MNAPAEVLAAVTQALKENGVVEYKVPAIQDLTWADIQKMDGHQLKEIRKHQDGAAKVDQIIAERLAARGVKVEDAVAEQARLEAEAVKAAAEAVAGTVLAEPAPAAPTPEEIAAAEAAVKTAEEAEAARVATETEAARIAAEAAVKKLQDEEAARIAATPKRFVYDFQARDEDGNPIGNKTHLEATSQEELDQKKEQSYQQAVRAIARLKKQKPVFRDPDPIQITQAEIDEAAANLVSEDPKVRAAAVTKIAASATQKESAAANEAIRLAEEARQSYIFLQNNVVNANNYNNCDANNNMLAKFLQENNLKWTAANLEIAIGNLEGQLAPVIRRDAPAAPVSAPPAANPAPAVPPVATATAAPATAPAATVAPAAQAPAATAPVVPVAPAPAAPAPAANPAPAPAPTPMRRPGVNAGIVPGQTLSGAAPTAKTAAQTRAELVKELRNMSADEMKRRHKLDPKFYEKVNAILASK